MPPSQLIAPTVPASDKSVDEQDERLWRLVIRRSWADLRPRGSVWCSCRPAMHLSLRSDGDAMSKSKKLTRREWLALARAAVTGAVAGAVRAGIDWLTS
jgi:hypothetical protein